MIIVKVLLVIGLLGIAVQDFRERRVLWVLFPFSGFLLALFHWEASPYGNVFLLNVLTNLLMTTMLLVLLYLYTKLVVGKPFLDHSIGSGDIFFFFCFSLGFAPMTYMLLLVLSFLFSLAVFLSIKSRLSDATVPLAGLMALFLVIVVSGTFFFDDQILFLL